MEPVTEIEVANAVRSLSSSRSFDAYDVNKKLLKDSLHVVLKWFTLFINGCLSQGVFVEDFKLSRVIPIFKKAVRKLTENYWSVLMANSLN